jgi:contractile injection system tube protein/LysM domain-containing protein
MELQHVSIHPEGKAAFDVLFNPNQYGIDKANQIAEIGVPGLEAPILQYVHGNTRALTMELFFDTYEEQTDVTKYTDQVYQLLKIDPSTHAPPICNIAWGKLQFRGVLDHVSGKFALFLADGTPVRATLSVTFKEFIDVKVLVREQPTQSADHCKTRVVKRGDRIDSLAGEEYGDSGNWRLIAEANGLDDPRHLRIGDRLAIPAIE